MSRFEQLILTPNTFDSRRLLSMTKLNNEELLAELEVTFPFDQFCGG